MATTADLTQPMNCSHDPITEAVIHLVTTNAVSEREQKKAVSRLRKLYPHSQPWQALNINFNATGVPTLAVGTSPGFRLSSDDETDIVLIQHNVVVISKLAPYPGWQKFRERAIAAWTGWRSATRNQTVNRIAERYINRLAIFVDEHDACLLKGGAAGILAAAAAPGDPHPPASSIPPNARNLSSQWMS